MTGSYPVGYLDTLDAEDAERVIAPDVLIGALDSNDADPSLAA